MKRYKELRLNFRDYNCNAKQNTPRFSKMIYFSSHKFAFSNLRFCAILRTFSSITREICVQIKNKVHHGNQLIEPDLMMYIHMNFSKKNHFTHSHTPLLLPIQNILLAVNPFHCFFAKSSGTGKNYQSSEFYLEEKS